MDSQPPRSRIRRWFSTGGPTVLLILGVAGATGAAYSIANDGAGGSGNDGPPRLSAENREALESFRDCMEEQGVDVPAPPEDGERKEDGEGDGKRFHRPPGPPPGGAPDSEDREKHDAAFEECKGELPDQIRERIEEHKQFLEEHQQEFEAFRSCMSDKGVEPPERGEDGKPERPSAEQREKFREAFEACRDELPDPPEGARRFHRGDGPPHGGPGPMMLPAPPPEN